MAPPMSVVARRWRGSSEERLQLRVRARAGEDGGAEGAVAVHRQRICRFRSSESGPVATRRDECPRFEGSDPMNDWQSHEALRTSK